jgi:molybdenum cofactor biosynthesis enzyme
MCHNSEKNIYAIFIEITEITLVNGVCVSNANLKMQAKVMKRISTNITQKGKVIPVHAMKAYR